MGSGAVTIEEEELSRLLLFIYGGSNAKWDRTEYLAIAEFFSLIADKTVKGKIGEGCCGRIRAIAVLGGFEANQLQKMLLSPNMEHRITHGKQQRLEVLRGL